VKTPVFTYLLPFCVLLFACGPITVSRSPADATTFDTAKRLEDFDFTAPDDGKPGEWLVIDNGAGRGLAQIDSEPAENRSEFATYRPLSGGNVYVSTRSMTISGVNRVGQAWHTLGIAARDDRLTVFLDDREIFVATDGRFSGPPKLACGSKPTA
jgi:hypothetical protein